MKLVLAAFTAALLSTTAQAAVQTPVKIQLNYGSGIKIGSAQYNGFTAAAKYWESVLTTSQPTTVNFNVNIGKLGPNILGSTRSSFTSRQVKFVESRIKARQDGAFDAALVLPGLSDGSFGADSALSVYTPGYTDNVARTGIDNATRVYDTDGGFNNSVIGLTTANAKAIGYAFAPGAVDASITFSSQFKFDYNPHDGIAAGQTDFVAVAIHEFGHAFGFVSGVDDYDVLGTGGLLADSDVCGIAGGCKNYDANNDWFGETLDLFRYSDKGALDWTTNTASYFSADGGATSLGGFSTGTYTGDGWQASHWKAPQVTLADGTVVFSCRRPKLGIMNPYICRSQPGIVTALDLKASDAIGWNIATNARGDSYAKSTTNIVHDLTAVPEPATWGMMIVGFGLVGAMTRRRVTAVAA